MQNNQLFVIAGVATLIALIYLLSPILTPFLLATLLAYLTDPLVKRLMRFKLSRTFSVSIVFLLIFLILFILILLIVPLVELQIANLFSIIPNVVDWLQSTLLPWLKDTFGVNEVYLNVANLKSILTGNLTKLGSAADWTMKTVLHSTATFVTWVVNLILIPVVAFYLLCDWTQFVKGIQHLFPKNIQPVVVRLMNECDEVLGAFFRGQLVIMLVVGILYSIGLTLVGLQVGVLIGIISGIITIVPYLGFIVGICLGTIAALVQFGDFSAVIAVWIVFIIVHAIENFLLLPRLMSNRIRLHPVAVIFAILAGGCLFGFIGVLIALPVAAVIMVCIRYIHGQYRNSELYKAT